MSHLLVPDKDPQIGPRKLSDMSASSDQTHQAHQSAASVASQGSSVVVTPTEPTAHSHVLAYIREHAHEFDPDDLFKQRQHRFVTTFTKNYDSVDTADAPLDVSAPLAASDRNTDAADAAPENGHIQYHDDSDELSDRFDDEEDDFEDDDDYDDMLPPSPPRSPPRELDPDKLYGLYDFSGPDPAHCSISRNEPVYLINDQDNYWWLVRKLTKDEKIVLRNQRYVEDDDEEEEILTDEEDGKVGFVPAECLETFGERLARLNCFKNEELEKSARDLLDQVGEAVELKEHSKVEEKNQPKSPPIIKSNDTTLEQPIETERSTSSLDLGSPVVFQNSPNISGLSRSGSILKNGSRPANINKSVTFEDLNDIVLDENNEDGSILDDYENNFPEHYYTLPEFQEPTVDEEKRSEVLSDVYPTETPLVVNKRNSTITSEKASVSPYQSHVEEKEWDDSGYSIEVCRASPQLKHASSSDESIARPVELPILSPGSAQDYYTPRNMPQSQFDTLQDSGNPVSLDDDDNYRTPVNHSFNEDSHTSTPASERLRRTAILDKLAQVTTDIEQELDMEEYDSYYDQSRFLRGIELTRDSSAPSSRAATHIQAKGCILPQNEPSDENGDEDNSGSELDEYIAQSSRIHNDDEFQDEASITPFTSVNSLSISNIASGAVKNNGTLTMAASDIADRRKSKPVHDMFVPILGKFDELAERLAEIDEML